jgi:hypothetical protein
MRNTGSFLSRMLTQTGISRLLRLRRLLDPTDGDPASYLVNERQSGQISPRLGVYLGNFGRTLVLRVGGKDSGINDFPGTA